MKGILFKPEMVRAILNGTKTETRRTIDPQPAAGVRRSVSVDGWEDGHGRALRLNYPVGATLAVKESWSTLVEYDDYDPRELPDDAPAWYLADGPAPAGYGRRRSSMFLPHRMARIRLTVTAVAPQRLQDISEAEAQAEGVERPAWDNASYRVEYARLWDGINGDEDGMSWRDNPWVWRIVFTRADEVTHG